MITAPIILTGGGKFPFVDGVPQIYTREQFEECCCPQPPAPPAPDTCPCTDWQPESWPCGGLLEEYAVVSGEWRLYGWDGGDCGLGTQTLLSHYRLLSPAVVTADPYNPCCWFGSASFEQYNTITEEWEASSLDTIWVTLDGLGNWMVTLGGCTPGTCDAAKATGLTPVGTYTNHCCFQEIYDNYHEYDSDAEVT